MAEQGVCGRQLAGPPRERPAHYCWHDLAVSFYACNTQRSVREHAPPDRDARLVASPAWLEVQRHAELFEETLLLP